MDNCERSLRMTLFRLEVAKIRTRIGYLRFKFQTMNERVNLPKRTLTDAGIAPDAFRTDLEQERQRILERTVEAQMAKDDGTIRNKLSELGWAPPK